MADEQLVSTVYFRGNSMGAVGIVIQDTSSKPAFTFSSPDMSGNTFNIRMSQQSTLQIRATPYIPNYSSLYFTLTTRDAFMYRASSPEMTIDGPGPIGRVTVVRQGDNTGLAYINIDLTYYPAQALTLARLEVFTDQTLTDRIGIFNLEAQPPRQVSLRLTSERNAGKNPEVEPYGIYNNDKLAVVYSDENMNQNYMTYVPFTLYIGGRKLDTGLYPFGSDNWIKGNLPAYIPIGFGSAVAVLIERQRNDYVRGNVPCSVVCGDYANGNTCIDDSYYPNGTFRMTLGDRGSYNGYGAGKVNLSASPNGNLNAWDYGDASLVQPYLQVGTFNVRLAGIQSLSAVTQLSDSVFLVFLNGPGPTAGEDTSTFKPQYINVNVNGNVWRYVRVFSQNNTDRRLAKQTYVISESNAHNNIHALYRSLVNQNVTLTLTIG